MEEVKRDLCFGIGEGKEIEGRLTVGCVEVEGGGRVENSSLVNKDNGSDEVQAVSRKRRGRRTEK